MHLLNQATYAQKQAHKALTGIFNTAVVGDLPYLVDLAQLIMKDRQLVRLSLPTTDMKKAIGKNAKEDEGLSIALKQIDKEKRLALDLYSRKQEAFVKQVLKRRESLSSHFKIPLLEQRNTVVGTEPHPNETGQVSRFRSWSWDETGSSSTTHKRSPGLDKRLSLPALVSALQSGDNDVLSRKTGVSDLTSARRTAMDNKNSLHGLTREEKATKMQTFVAQASIRRQSVIALDDCLTTGTDSRPFPRRRRAGTLPTIVTPGIENE